MRIALIADAFPPMRTSGAVQMRDLAREMVRQGHAPTVLVPSPEIRQPWMREEIDGVEVVRLKAPATKDISYVRRTVNELRLPFVMLRNFRRSPLRNVRWDGVVWYSPTIFLGPLANWLKKGSGCRGYLIVRDVFPEWAVDMGLMRRGMAYRAFKAVERYQYGVADVIGAQTAANLPYFDRLAAEPGRRVEVLQNWLAEAPDIGCSISVATSPLAGRTIFVYAGNMGVAQGMDILIDLADQLRGREDIGFLFVGRGRDAARLRDDALARGLSNVAFFDEIDPAEIPGLYTQCHVGIVALERRHKTHNIPGKFLSYMQAGLPVLASINAGNDLKEIIDRNGVGRVCTKHCSDSLRQLAERLVEEIAADAEMRARCRALAVRLFSPEAAVRQIVAGLSEAGAVAAPRAQSAAGR